MKGEGMSDEWIKYRVGLPTNPRVVKLAGILKKPVHHITGALMAFWAVGDQHTTDGVLDGYTPEVVDDLIGIRGFADALQVVGWLEVGEGFVTIPNFDKHNSQSAKRRASKAKDMARYRGHSVDDERPQNDHNVTTKRPPDKTRQEKKTPPPSPRQETASGGGGGAGGVPRDAGWEERKAYWRKKPDWWPGKPWVSARGLDELADLTGVFTTDEVKAIMADVRRQCSSLTNPAGYLVKAFRAAKAEKGGA